MKYETKDGQIIDYQNACEMGDQMRNKFIRAFSQSFLDKVKKKEINLGHIGLLNQMRRDVFFMSLDITRDIADIGQVFITAIKRLDQFMIEKNMKITKLASNAAIYGRLMKSLTIDQATALGFREPWIGEFKKWFEQMNMHYKTKSDVLKIIIATYNDISANTEWSAAETEIAETLGRFMATVEHEYPGIKEGIKENADLLVNILDPEGIAQNIQSTIDAHSNRSLEDLKKLHGDRS
ncbi:MAG: hypothetical protein FWD15_04185 [Alphaproteobacteria bacterium]|nr:hypothetical protein [Alphaproteobacteria bacterium]